MAVVMGKGAEKKYFGWNARSTINDLVAHFVLYVGLQGMVISESRVFVAEGLSSSAEQLLRQKPVATEFNFTLLSGDPKHMHSSQGVGEP